MTIEQQQREAGGKWLYTLWVEELLGIEEQHPDTSWRDYDESFREHYRVLWDKVNEGFRRAYAR